VITIADQILQEIKHLRLDSDEVPASPQLPPLNVKRVVLKRVDHRDLKGFSSPLAGKNQGNPRN
jgi:hypothetical protein